MHSINIVLLVVVVTCATLVVCEPSISQKLKADGFELLGPSIRNSKIQMQLWISTDLLKYFEAYDYCKLNGVEGKLVSIINHAQRDYINTKLRSLGFPAVWTSAIYNPTADWTWLSEGSLMTYLLWFGGNVPEAPTSSHCGYFQSGLFENGLRSFDCETPFRFICEVPL